ncbi:MAG: putative 14-3-3 protein 7 [Streblomastix strix]|uniref:Putative 14-3-3 protein 7 n=1 Tax=Streblomastix strix TaxID=222440 RepID=A0A5J4UBC4_9EUKA|nr:MAG: putative 14-3-3 protein 7 [Streblomastix strix]
MLSTETSHDNDRMQLSSAFKSTIFKKRKAWRVLATEEQREEAAGKNIQKIRQLRLKEEEDMTNFCNDVISRVDSEFFPAAQTADSRVFVLKMKGDYFRYMCEYMSGNARREAAENSIRAYQEGLTLAKSTLSPTNPTRLGLVMNYSVFINDILDRADLACRLSKESFDEALENLENIGKQTEDLKTENKPNENSNLINEDKEDNELNELTEEPVENEDDRYKQTIFIMQLIKDNVMMWSTPDEDGEQNI